MSLASPVTLLRKSRSPFIAGGAFVFLGVMASGCGQPAELKSTEGEVPQTMSNLRSITYAYNQALTSLGHAPASAADLKPFLEKYGNSTELLRTAEGAPFTIQWGFDPRKQKFGEQMPIWIYEPSPHDGKRWVVRFFNAMEMPEEELKNATFAPGMKAPN